MNKSFLFGALISGMFVASCGGGDDTASTEQDTGTSGGTTTFNNTLSNAGRTTAPLRQLGGLLEQSGISGFYFPSFGSGSSGVSAQSQNCSQLQETGNSADADGDGVPVNASYTFNCSFADGTYQGTVSARDDNDSDPLSGFDFCTGTFGESGCTREPLNITYTYSGTSFTLHHILDLNIDWSGGSYIYTTLFAQNQYTYGGQNLTWTLEGNNFSYTPDSDGDNDPFDAGTYDGQINITLSSPDVNTSLTIQFNNVHFGTCSDGGADRGTVTISYSCPAESIATTATITVNINGCNNSSGTVTDCDGNTMSF